MKRVAKPVARPPRGTRALAGVTIRDLASHQDLLDCVALQREIWGADFQECTPPALLKVMQRIGGVAVGAFDADGVLVGFVVGMTGVTDGRLVHWSHMLGVRAAARGAGIGRTLKEYQREMVAELGAEVICWSFDPLVSRNAHLNLNLLGARVAEYVADMYPPTASKLHGAIPIDRLVVEWPTSAGDGVVAPTRLAESEAEGGAEEADDGAVLLDWRAGDGGGPDELRRRLTEGALARIIIPREFERLLETDAARAVELRALTRAYFQACLDLGYRIDGFSSAPDGDPHYLLARR